MSIVWIIRTASQNIDGARTKRIAKTMISLTSIAGAQVTSNILDGVRMFEVLYKVTPKTKDECKQLAPLAYMSRP